MKSNTWIILIGAAVILVGLAAAWFIWPGAWTIDRQENTNTNTNTETSAELSWETYQNERFGFSVEYPAGVMTGMALSQNGDGATFSTADGSATLRVSGANNVLEEDIPALIETARESFTTVASVEETDTSATIIGVDGLGRTLRERIVVEDGTIYRVVLAHGPTILSESAADRIMDSLTVLAPGETFEIFKG